MRYASLAIYFVNIPVVNRLQKYDNYFIRQNLFYMARNPESELEVDEGLEVGGDELVERQGHEDDGQRHEPQRHGGEPEAVAALQALWQPVD